MGNRRRLFAAAVATVALGLQSGGLVGVVWFGSACSMVGGCVEGVR
jgi:hypothetical protein